MRKFILLILLYCSCSLVFAEENETELSENKIKITFISENKNFIDIYKINSVTNSVGYTYGYMNNMFCIIPTTYSTKNLEFFCTSPTTVIVEKNSLELQVGKNDLLTYEFTINPDIQKQTWKISPPNYFLFWTGFIACTFGVTAGTLGILSMIMDENEVNKGNSLGWAVFGVASIGISIPLMVKGCPKAKLLKNSD